MTETSMRRRSWEHGLRAWMLAMKTGTALLPFRPPETLRGPGSLAEFTQSLGQRGHRHVLVVTDAVLAEIGLVARLTDLLADAGVAFTVFDGVEPDPSIEQVEAGLAVLKACGADAVLGFGGGSPLDAAKLIAARATNDKPVRKMEGLFRVFRSPLPLHAVPTTAGTGSETTFAAVVSDRERGKKMTIIDLKLRPTSVALDGELMTGIPPHVTAATGMDALTHAVEAYLSRNATAATDALALSAAERIVASLPTAFANGADVGHRQTMAEASYDAGAAFTIAGVGYVHAIAHQFGARYHTPHGLANAIVLPHVLEWSRPECTARMADLGRAAGCVGSTDDDMALAFIERIRALNESFAIPSRLADLERGHIAEISRGALAEAHATYAVPRYMDGAACAVLVGQMLPLS